MAKSDNLRRAKAAKNDEFYITDITAELSRMPMKRFLKSLTAQMS